MTSSLSAADLFYAKQIGFAATPFITVTLAFIFWYIYGILKGTPFFAKRQRSDSKTATHNDKPAKQLNEDMKSVNEDKKTVTPKDKFVVTVGVVMYLIFPTLCAQAFRLFDCKTIANVQYLGVDFEHQCYEGAHIMAVLLLGIGQLVLYVIGLPILILLLLRHNRKIFGGLDRDVVQVRYGLFFSAYREKTYFWEIVLTGRKVGIVAISVFGKSIGTPRQAQIALLILFTCASLEIAGDPYKISSERHKILSRLELSSLFCLWGTMWCGTLIFASQGPDEEGLVMVLSIFIAVVNIGIMVWLVFQLVLESAYENGQSRLVGVMEKLVLGLCSHGKSESSNDKGGEGAKSAEISIEMSSRSQNPLYAGNADAVFNPAFDSVNASSEAGWIKYFDASSSRHYWYNKRTRESKWDE